MASAAPLEQTEAPEADAPEVIDYEAEARKMGWTPQEDYKGDPKHFVDAETFYGRAVEYMPIAKATIKTLSKRLDEAERQAKRAAEFFSKAEQRAYERAIADIRAEQEAAVESGDIEAHRKAAEKLDKLEKPSSESSPAHTDDDQYVDNFIDWKLSNRWYDSNETMRIYADAQAAKIAKGKNDYLDRADLDEVAKRVQARFGEHFPEAFGKVEKPKPRSAVEGVTNIRAPRGGKSFADLPAEAQRMCDKWVKSGLIKSREDYVKSYDWS